MQSLQMRIVGNGVQIGGQVFQCFEDVKTWVIAKFPIKRYGLFVDGVSLLHFFSFVHHVDTEKSMSAFYNQQKSGFASMYEAHLAASTQNLFPMVFGRSNSAGMDDSEYLPALQDPDKWDNGLTGLRYQINRGMSNVEFQLESSIDSILKNYPEPQQIAKECLYKSKRFVMDLCSFITQDFQKWQHRGHSKKDSWRMTTVCVRRIFEKIHSQRVVAWDIFDIQDGEFTCAKFLWATWKAHDTMSAYVRHQFYEHLSIATVLARHLADNHVKPDEAVLSSLDKAVKNINGSLDSLQHLVEKVKKDIKAYAWWHLRLVLRPWRPLCRSLRLRVRTPLAWRLLPARTRCVAFYALRSARGLNPARVSSWLTTGLPLSVFFCISLGTSLE